MKKEIPKELKIFIDFDDAIFYTKAFKEGLIGVFEKNGVSEEDFSRTYRELSKKNKSGIAKRDPYNQIRFLEKELGIDGKKTKSDLDRFLKNSRKYIFKDINPFLKNFSKNNLHIITFGHAKFQAKKIDGCNLKRYFKRIVVTDKIKSEVISRFSSNGDVFVFIDDRIEQIDAVKKKFKKCITFFIKRKEGRYKDKKTKYVDYEVKNFKEIEKILKSLTV
ncbi:MAG: hypothetical protein WC831_05505 [Parcubacteria group bacterium]|jgi:FMN phosphatase YigB (HAD superfamily)